MPILQIGRLWTDQDVFHVLDPNTSMRQIRSINLGTKMETRQIRA